VAKLCLRCDPDVARADRCPSPKLDRPEIIDFSTASKEESNDMLALPFGLLSHGLAVRERPVISQDFKRAILRQGSVKKLAVTFTRIKSQDNDGTTDGASRQQWGQCAHR